MHNGDYGEFSMPKNINSPYFQGNKQGLKIRYSTMF